MNASQSVFERLQAKLQAADIAHHVLRHEPVYTSQQAADIRGATLASGAKALICKADGAFVHIVLPADRKLASKQVRRDRGIRSLRFASRDEVAELTGLQPGAIPPFGSLFALPTWCDQRLADEPEINFNAGDHGISIRMSSADFLRLEQPLLGLFAD